MFDFKSRMRGMRRVSAVSAWAAAWLAQKCGPPGSSFRNSMARFRDRKGDQRVLTTQNSGTSVPSGGK